MCYCDALDQEVVVPKVSLLFYEEDADVAQRAADVLACPQPTVLLPVGPGRRRVLTIACDLERFESLLDDETAVR